MDLAIDIEKEFANSNGRTVSNEFESCFVQAKTENLDIEIKDWSHFGARPSKYRRMRGTFKTSVVPTFEIPKSDQVLLLTPS
jgi:hypothetical protein